MNNKINVTKVFLPPLEEYTAQVKRAFDNAWLTNRGELVLELETKLKNHLGIEHLLLMNNGTIPLQILMHLLGEKGEIITTPFSYVATTAEIQENDFNLNIPRYVDTFEEEAEVDIAAVQTEIDKLEGELVKVQTEINQYLTQLVK